MADQEISLENALALASNKAPPSRRFGNAAPLGLCAFGTTTFLLSLINLDARGVSQPNMVVASAYGYGGLAQLLAGMWNVYSTSSPLLDDSNSLSGKWRLATLSMRQLSLLSPVSGSLLPSSSLQEAFRSWNLWAAKRSLSTIPLDSFSWHDSSSHF